MINPATPPALDPALSSSQATQPTSDPQLDACLPFLDRQELAREQLLIGMPVLMLSENFVLVEDQAVGIVRLESGNWFVGKVVFIGEFPRIEMVCGELILARRDRVKFRAAESADVPRERAHLSSWIIVNHVGQEEDGDRTFEFAGRVVHLGPDAAIMLPEKRNDAGQESAASDRPPS